MLVQSTDYYRFGVGSSSSKKGLSRIKVFVPRSSNPASSTPKDSDSKLQNVNSQYLSDRKSFITTISQRIKRGLTFSKEKLPLPVEPERTKQEKQTAALERVKSWQNKLEPPDKADIPSPTQSQFSPKEAAAGTLKRFIGGGDSQLPN